MIESAIGSRENIRIIDSAEYGSCKIEIMEYQKLLGSTNTNSAIDLYYMEKQNMKARQIAIYLNNDAVAIEPGAMSYFKYRDGFWCYHGKCVRKSVFEYYDRRTNSTARI